jgi:hypothetical protein
MSICVYGFEYRSTVATVSSFDSSALISSQSSSSTSLVFSIRPQVLAHLQQVWQGYHEAYDKINVTVRQLTDTNGVSDNLSNIANFIPTFLITENE